MTGQSEEITESTGREASTVKRRVMRIMRPDGEVTNCPVNVNLKFLNEQQAYENHSQNLDKLASRGGLSACEAVAIIERRWWKRMEPQDAIDRLNELIGA